MAALTHQRCFHHSLREAVARCPECRQFYCRECITEHDDRVICANCLRKLAVSTEGGRKSFAWFMPALQCAVGLAVLWWVFYFFGATLLSIPSSYHEGTIWADKWWKDK